MHCFVLFAHFVIDIIVNRPIVHYLFDSWKHINRNIPRLHFRCTGIFIGPDDGAIFQYFIDRCFGVDDQLHAIFEIPVNDYQK